MLLNADDWSVYRVVDVWQVGLSWTLSDSTEFVVDGSVTKANPSLVGTEIWYGNATQVGADSGANQHAGVTGIREGGNGFFIKKSGVWESVGLSDLRDSKSSNEDDLTVPSSLENLTWWKLGDIELLVGISDVSSSGNHLIVDDREDCLDTKNVR